MFGAQIVKHFSLATVSCLARIFPEMPTVLSDLVSAQSKYTALGRDLATVFESLLVHLVRLAQYAELRIPSGAEERWKHHGGHRLLGMNRMEFWPPPPLHPASRLRHGQ